MTDLDQRQLGKPVWSIGDYLSAAEADKLAWLKIHKKGLMQQLFPLPEGG